jgi:hypothetical protein
VLCFLGPAAVLTNGLLRPLELRPKVLALLVRLALGDGAQDRDVLADLLFPDAANPRESLRWHLSQLRARLPLQIEADRRTIALTAETDVARFRLGAERILRYGLEDAATILALYRGDLCTGLRVTASPTFTIGSMFRRMSCGAYFGARRSPMPVLRLPRAAPVRRSHRCAD